MPEAVLGEVAAPTRSSAWRGTRDAFGTPGVVMGASFIGFGSLVRESGLALSYGLASTATGWALPGQLALVELTAAGGSLIAITLAVALTNARLLPMSVSLMPLLRHPRHLRALYYVAAHFIALTGWAQLMRHAETLPQRARLAYHLGFTVALWSISLLGTALGWFLAQGLPQPITLGLVFLNPIYFLLLFLMEIGSRPRAIALLLGAAGGPLLHLVSPDWGLLLTGLIAGTAAFLIDRSWRRRRGG